MSITQDEGLYVLKPGGAKEWKVENAFVNLRQDGDFARIYVKAAPALLNNSFLYDPVQDRPLTNGELWSVMGFREDDISEHLSFIEGLPLTIKHSESCQLLGNAMHLMQCAAFSLYTLACTRKNLGESNDGST